MMKRKEPTLCDGLKKKKNDLPLMSIECDESPGAREEEDLEVE